MFGYVKVDLPNLYIKDNVLYKAMYCGLCKGIGKNCGQRGRLTLSYDLTFLSVLLHNVCNVDVKVERQKCVIHQFKKRPIATYDELTGKIANLNIILAYYKVVDDIIDSKTGKLKKAMLKKAYNKAKKNQPKLDEIVKNNYENLRKYERENSSSIDLTADVFGNMLQEVVKEISGKYTSSSLENLAYNLGKYVYLIDALDDFDKDLKKSQFNVLVNAYQDCKSKQELVEKHGKDLIYVYQSVLNLIDEYSRKIEYNFNHDLTDNILQKGLKNTFKEILENKKCKKTTKY